jgi:surface carbohydrate biosynthesis protein
LPKKQVDVLLFVEHVARELDIACAIKYLANHRYSMTVEVASMMFDIRRTLDRLQPQVVAIPYCFAITSFNVPSLLSVWPCAKYVNLAYEQIFRRHQLSSKAPGDSFARESVVHHSWAKFNSDFLIENGVRSENIVLNGNPTYSLYTQPYTSYFPSREELAALHGLDECKNWVFVPENYGAAFGTDRSVRHAGADSVDQAQAVSRFALDSFRDAVVWWARLAKEEDVELIVRPRPATPESKFSKAVEQHIDALPNNLHVIKSGTTREWILASDSTFSSYSTSLIESSVASKPSFMLAPRSFPDYLNADWHGMIPHVETYEQFRDAACNPTIGPERNALGNWAEREMMSTGDPISNLVELLRRARDGEVQAAEPVTEEEIVIANPVTHRGSIGKRFASKGRRILAEIYHSVGGKPPSNHEDDSFNQSDVDDRVSRWQTALG